MQRVGQRIAEARQAAKMTQERLAVVIGLGRSSVANMEAGRQSVDAVQLALIARALHVGIDALLPGDDLPPEPELPHDVEVVRVWQVTCLTCAGGVSHVYRDRAQADQARDEHIACLLPPVPDGEAG